MTLSVSLQCSAIAAAATGDAGYVEYVEGDSVLNTLGFFNDGLVDIVSAGATHTMERQTNVVSPAKRCFLIPLVASRE